MAFVPIVNLKQVKSFTSSPKFGKVVNNNDPKKLGRVKVNIPGLFEGEEGYLPWIRRKMDTIFCGLNCEIFDVPEVDSVVQVQWDYDNETPTYTGAPYNQKHQTMTFAENYPYEAGMKFGDCVIKFDKTANYIRIYTPATEISIDGTGLVMITGARMQIDAKDLTINAKHTTFTGDVSVCGSMESTVGASGLMGMSGMAMFSNGMAMSIE